MSTKSIVACLYALLFLLFLPSTALSWTPGLKEAAEAFALGKATPAQEMAVFVNNYEINLMAQDGKISKSAYRSCQEEFFSLNEKFAGQAVSDAGFDSSISNRKFNPGTDTDVNVLGKGGTKVTLNDIKKINGNYQSIVKEHFRSKGLNPPAGNIGTETDFMPHPKHTDPDEFKKIVSYVNQNGGTAYTDPKAAAAQGKLGTTQPMSIDEASSFSSTMKDMADTKIQKANALRDEARAIRGSNPGKAEFLEAKARQFDYQAAKYHNRIDAANNHIRRQNGLPENPRNITGFQQSADIIELSGRNPFTGKDASTIHNLHQSALQSSTDDMIDTLVDLAKKDPSKAGQISKALAKEINRLPANRAGQAIGRIESATKGVKGLDKALATTVVAESKALKQAATATSKWNSFKGGMKNASGINGMTKLSVVMTAGGALLTAYQGVSITLDNVKATDTLWDYFKNCYYHAAWEGTGIGPAFEQAQREEIERYMKEFEAGQSPNMAKHVTFTMLKTGVYMGRDAIIGILYLPDTVWEFFTQEKEMEGYAAMQNELARVMKQMVLDRQAFEQVMTNMKKMGLHESDAKPYLDCLCGGCGGSLGGFFNPECTSDIGHGPCQCNGPLTIWKTPLPAGDKQAQYDCFNRVAKMRYDEARAIFDQWNQQMADENAKSVQPEMDKIREEVMNRKALEDEDTARGISDRFEGIRDLLRPEDADYVRATVGPYLENFAARNVERGDIARAVDNQNRAVSKVGMRDFQSETYAKQRKDQYEKWDKAWREAKETFPVIEGQARDGKLQQALGAIETLEYRMTKDHLRPLPPAVKDPDFVALKKRVDGYRAEYNEFLDKESKRAFDLERDRERRAAVTVLEELIAAWEHPPFKLNELNQRLAACKSAVKEAENAKATGEHYEKAGDVAQAIHQYKISLSLQVDGDVERALARLQEQSGQDASAAADAEALWKEGGSLQGEGKYGEAIAKYKAGLALKANPAIEARVKTLEKYLAVSGKPAQGAPAATNQAVAKQAAPAPSPAPAQPSPQAPKAVPAAAPAPSPDAGQAQGAETRKAQSRGFAGQWETDWGVLVLEIASGSGQVTGTYPHDEGRISGQLSPDGSVLTGTWSEAPSYQPPRDAGRIEFVLGSDATSFTGKWGYGDEDMTGAWVGKRWTGDQAASAPSGQEPSGAVSPAAQVPAEPHPGADSATGQGVAAGATATTPQGWQRVTMGNVSFAVPASWQHSTREQSDVEVLHLYWEGSFDSPVHGISGGITTDYALAEKELPDSRVVQIDGADVLRADDGPGFNLLFPPMPGNRGVALVFFRGEKGSQATIDAVLRTISINADGQTPNAEGQSPNAEGQSPGGSLPQGEAPDSTAAPEVLFNNGNVGAVQNGPTQPTVFRLNEARLLALIENYHWNNGQGATPGTIALRGADGKTYGPWQTDGMEGMGGVPNAAWTAWPMIVLPAGTYTVMDSDPGSWAQNEESEGRGFTRVETMPANTGIR